MDLPVIESDQLYTWSDEQHTEGATGDLAQTPHGSPAPTTSTPGDPAWLPDRALQALRQAGMQMRRRSRSRSQVLPVCQLPGLAAANGLRATGVLHANSGTPRQLSPSPRDPRGDLRDQPRIAAPSGGALTNRHERITGCPPCPARRRIGQRVARQYAGRLPRRQSKLFSSSSSSSSSSSGGGGGSP